MRFADEITAVATKWAEMGYEVPDSVHVGTNRYREILEEFENINGATFIGRVDI